MLGKCRYVGFDAIHDFRHPLRALDSHPWIGGTTVYVFINIYMDQITNNNALGGEILGHLTFLIFSLLYFLMFLF